MRKGVSGVVSVVFLSLVLIAVIGLMVYFFHVSTYISRVTQEVAMKKAESMEIAKSVTGTWEYDDLTHKLYINITNRYTHPVVITRIVIIYPDHTFQLTSIRRVIIEAGETRSFEITGVKEEPASIAVGAASATGVGTVISASKYTPPPANATQAGITYSLIYTPVVLSRYSVATLGYNSTQTNPIPPTGYNVLTGLITGGGLDSLQASGDGDQLVIVSENATVPRFPGFENWRYYIEINVTERTGTTLTNYAINITLNNANFDFSHAKTDGSDIRFLGPDGRTLLDYWIEKWNQTSQEAVVWVKIPELPGGQTITIYMLYGNPDANLDQYHYGLTKVMEPLPASDGSNYRIQYQEWVMPVSGLVGGGNAMGWHSDDYQWRYNLPFNFPYYSGEYDHVAIASNGYIQVNGNSGWSDYSDSVGEMESRMYICPLWEDLMTSGSYDIYINNSYIDEYGEGIAIRWYACFYSYTGTANFEVILYRNGLIRIDYGTVDGRTYDIPTVGVSFGDNTHYTISSYNNHQADWYSNRNSLMFWPRKVASTEPSINVGEEKSNILQLPSISVELGWSGISPSTVVELRLEGAVNVSSFRLEVYENSSGTWNLVSLYENSIPSSITVNRFFGYDIVGFRLNLTSTDPFSLSLDYAAITCRTLDENSPLLAVMENNTEYMLIYNIASDEWVNVSLPGASINPCLFFDYDSMSFIVLNGTWILSYDPYTGTVEQKYSVSPASGDSAFIIVSKSYLLYGPGDGSNSLFVYDDAGALVGSYSLPEPVEPYTCSAYDPQHKIAYIMFGGTGHVYSIIVGDNGIPSVSQVALDPSPPTAYPVGIDYGEDHLWVIGKGGGIHSIDLVTGKVSSLGSQPPYYPMSEGDRLAYVELGEHIKLYHVREDGTSEIWIIDVR